MIRKPLAVAALTLLCFVAGCSDDAPKSNGEVADSTTSPTDDSRCAQVDAPAPKPDGGATKPTDKDNLDASEKNTVMFATSCGNFTVTLDVKAAPSTTASVALLAKSGFYDDTVFHRIVPGFVIQGGDPTASGRGGPGYQTVDKPASDAKYTSGVVAMAKTADEAAGTSGSQFYVVTAADSGLPPDYAIIGKVTDGMDSVKRIEALGTPTEQPSRPVVVKKATFSAK